ncbi:MAG TPA: hypothetical protein ENN19_01945 [Chloroflexi bacterium]|nr:hypothetical protein [Chloroflexota bacterium]
MLRENNLLSLISFVIAAGLGLAIWVFLPHDREVQGVGILLFKLLPFLFASLSIATVKRDLFEKYNLRLLIIIASFLGFFCFLVPKIFYHYINPNDEKFYYTLLVTTPYIILSLVLAYRLGGGGPGKSFRLSIAMLLLMLSGIEDLAYFIVNDGWSAMPDVWPWVTHISVFIGRPPTTQDIIILALLRVLMAVIVLFFPLSKFLQMLKRKVAPSS